MPSLKGFQIQSGADTAEVCSVASSLSDTLIEIKDAISTLRENFRKLFAGARQSQAQMSNAARQTASAIGYLRAPQTVLIRSDRTEGGAVRPMQAWHDPLQQMWRREELAFWQSRLALTKSGSQAQLKVEQQAYGFLKQLARETEQVRVSDVDEEKRSAVDEYRGQLQLIDTQRRLGELSAAQAIAQDQELLRQKWELGQQSFNRRDATAADQLVQQQIVPNEMASYQHYLTQQGDLFSLEAAQLENELKPVSDKLAIFSTDVIFHTQKIARAFNEMLRSVMKDLLRSSFNSFFTSLFGSFGGISAVDSGGGLGMVGGLLGDVFKGFLGGIGSSAWSGIGSILGIGEGAAKGAVPGLLWDGIGTGIGNTAADFSSAVGGAAFGGSLLGKMASMLPAAAGGWVVPHFTRGGILSVLHQREMVLPAHLSDGLQAAIAGGGLGGGHTFNISAVDAAGVARLFRNNGAALVAALNGAMRHGSILAPVT